MVSNDASFLGLGHNNGHDWKPLCCSLQGDASVHDNEMQREVSLVGIGDTSIPLMQRYTKEFRWRTSLA